MSNTRIVLNTSSTSDNQNLIQSQKLNLKEDETKSSEEKNPVETFEGQKPAKIAKLEDADLVYSPEWMEEAFREARLALTEGEVPVGAIFLRDGVVQTKARNTVNRDKNPTKHAEIICIEELEKKFKGNANLAKSEYFSKCVVYVNCEPCIMCASALCQVGVKAIYFGCSNPRFGGCGSVIDVFDKLKGDKKDKSTFISKGHRSEEAIDLLKEFYKGENPNAPPEKRKPARP